MSIKRTLTRAAEKITGRKCTRCRHNCKRRCCHPDGEMFMKCWNSFTRPGFEKRRPRYLKPEDFKRRADVTDCEELKRKAQQYLAEIEPQRPTIELTAMDLQDFEPIEPAPLTPEQEHQLAKIKATLQEAGETARDGGLLED